MGVTSWAVSLPDHQLRTWILMLDICMMDACLHIDWPGTGMCPPAESHSASLRCDKKANG
jgi:hypothetical protein